VGSRHVHGLPLPTIIYEIPDPLLPLTIQRPGNIFLDSPILQFPHNILQRRKTPKSAKLGYIIPEWPEIGHRIVFPADSGKICCFTGECGGRAIDRGFFGGF
jgi:hypothetical protein